MSVRHRKNPTYPDRGPLCNRPRGSHVCLGPGELIDCEKCIALESGTTENPRTYGHYEGHDLPESMTIWSVGVSPLDAIRAFCRARLGDHVTDIDGELRPLPTGDPLYQWGFAFTADGTGFKAAGIIVPGGVILTWWK